MKYYKVVRPTLDPNRFTSIIQDGYAKTFLYSLLSPKLKKFLFKILRATFHSEVKTQTHYYRGKWTFSKPTLHQMGYDLLIFTNLPDAHDAIVTHGWNDHAIFEVDVFCTKKTLPPIRTIEFGPSDSWKSWPDGTIMAWGVRLAKEVEE